jgi:flagellar motor switch protein FliM
VDAGRLREFRRHRFHDFQKTRILSDEQARALDTLHRKFARAASEALTALVRGRVELSLLGVSQRTYFDFIRSLQNPTSLHLVYCLPRELPFVLELSPAVLFPMMERLLGGTADDIVQPVRPFTRVEQALLAGVAERLLGALRETWMAAGSEELRFALAEAEHNPLLMQVVGPSEPAIVLGFQVAFSRSTGRAHLCLPAKPFCEVLDQLTRSLAKGARRDGNSATERKRILKGLSAAELSITLELDPLPLGLGDLLTLKPGDVVDTQIHRGAEVAISVEGHKLFRGLPVVHEGRRAFKILGGGEGD